MRRPPRIALGSLGFLAVKLTNLALVTLYSFGIIYVLVRVVPPGFYPWMVLLASIGGYVLATDMGFSAYVYAEVRRNFLRNSLDGADDLVSQATTLYVGLSLAAIALAALVIPIFAPVTLAPAMTAYFATIVLPLPWMLVRRVAAALDLYVAMETLECIRRAIFCVLAATMLFGVSLFEFSLACLAGWGIAAAAAWWLLRRHGFTVRLGSPRRIALFWSANRSGVLKSGKYAALEFFVYNLPYITIPIIFHGPADLVAFDLFNKVSRFGGAAYSVPAEVFSPPQTRAFYEGDADAVVRYQRTTWAFCMVPLVIGSVLLAAYGGPIFTRLLAGSQSVAPLVRVAMILMLAALLLQSSSGGFLVAVSKYDELAAVAAITAGLIVAAMVATAIGGISFPVFMLLYVAVYWFHAVALQWLFMRLRGSPPPIRAPLAVS